MKPMHFVTLAIVALVSVALALTSYAANNTWTPGRVTGARMFPALASNAGNVAAIELRQGTKQLTLEKADNGWRLKERGGYPVPADKVRALMVSLAEADLVEAKTRLPDRYGLIDLEDPTGVAAKSRSVRLLDGKGGVIADAVVGKKRSDAFALGKVATYVRKPGDAQTWLANIEVDASADLKDWIKTDVFQVDSSKVSRVTIEIPGEQPLKIERGADKKLAVAGIPPGLKLKDEGAGDAIARAAAYVDFDDVRKQPAVSPKDASTIKLETESGPTVNLLLRKDGDAQWLTVTATGEGDAKKAADDITARTAGWEYQVSKSKADSLLKRRSDLLEKIPEPPKPEGQKP